MYHTAKHRCSLPHGIALSPPRELTIRESRPDFCPEKPFPFLLFVSTRRLLRFRRLPGLHRFMAWCGLGLLPPLIAKVAGIPADYTRPSPLMAAAHLLQAATATLLAVLSASADDPGDRWRLTGRNCRGSLRTRITPLPYPASPVVLPATLSWVPTRLECLYYPFLQVQAMVSAGNWLRWC